MPRFYFDFYDGPQRIIDQTGLEFPDRATARNQAVSALAEAVLDALPGGGNRREFLTSIRDESGQVIFRAALIFLGEWSGE